jgi:uncharacterized protein YqeY
MLNKIKEDTVKAMREKSQLDLSVLRMLKSAIENAQIAKKGELSSAEIVGLIRKQITQRQDSADQFRNGGREELANKELAEISVLQGYLPVEWSDEQLETNVQLAIDNLGASGKKDMGRVIKAVAESANGQCDNKRISQIVAKKLN